MLLIQEVRDLFIVQYKYECIKHNAREINFATQDKILASWMASGQQNISDRLNLLTTFVDIPYTPVTTFTTYDLPSNYGKPIRTEPELKFVDIKEIPTTTTNNNTLPQGCVHSMAIFNDGDGFKCTFMDLPASTGNVRLWYTINTLMYSPSGGTSQDWGNFNGTTFSGNLQIPDKYIDVLILYMLSRCFEDKKAEYENEILRLKGDGGSTYKQAIEYNLGGYH